MHRTTLIITSHFDSVSCSIMTINIIVVNYGSDFLKVSLFTLRLFDHTTFLHIF